ncbi:MAG: hypothetical protein LBV46_03040 [Bacteroidales bacterium]|jgi:UDP-N-acetylmuramate--alanine ligase|nr:hypothetical protein [Bacteroidales bacterium]
MHNVLNATAAIAAAIELQTIKLINAGDYLAKIGLFTGVKRRFDYQIIRDDLVYVDDYAHHPEEIKSIVGALKTIYKDKKITGVFQPHLYSRTRDFATDFAAALALLDQIILLNIYPAREKPIEGITSQYLLDLIPTKNKCLLSKQELIPYLQKNRPEVLLTIGAGDIDKLVPRIADAFL